MQISVESIPELSKAIVKTAGNFVFAGVVGLNRTAKIAANDVKEQMKKVFNRPTPFALNSIRIKFADKKDKNPYAELNFKDKSNTQPPFILPEVEGGARPQKPFEKAFARGGEGAALLKAPYEYMIPTRAAPLDQYGNVKGSVISNMISDIVGATKAGYNAKTKGGKSGGGPKYRAVYANGRPMIMYTAASKAYPILVGVTKVQYRKRLYFAETITKSYDKNFEIEYSKAIKEFT